MDSINSILIDRDFKEPEEIDRLKDYIESVYDANSEIQVNQKGLVIIVNSSALANALRLNLPQIKSKLSINSKLSIRIR